MSFVLETKNLTHTYSTGTPFEMTAIRDVNFHAEKGEFIGIIGHTGSGKSTLIQHLNGLIRPTSGSVYLDGQDIFSSKEFTRTVRFRVGLVFQYPEYQLFEETVYKDIAYGPKNMKLPPDEIDRRVREAAGFVGLDESVLEASPFDLSGGQKRRVAIAGVIAMRPEVLVLDEPIAGLDPAGRRAIIDNIEAFHRSTGSTVIMVTHSMEDAARYCSRMVVMNHGSVAMEGTPAQIFTRAEELEAMGLSVPEPARVISRLRRMGLDVDASAYSVSQAADAIMALKGGAGNA